MTDGTKQIITRKTAVVSVSLANDTAFLLDQITKSRNQTKSAYISWLIKNDAESKRWKDIYEQGAKSAKKFNITSEEDIDKILHA